MKRLLTAIIVFVSCFPLFSVAQNSNVTATLLTKDSMMGSFTFAENWLLSEEDNIAFAEPKYDDSKWRVIYDSKLSINPRKKDNYVLKGIVWMRLHIYVDSSVEYTSFAFMLKHMGASEIYIDGKKVQSYGEIKGPDDSKYESPNGVPFIVDIHPGEHVIAVRYACFNAVSNYNTYSQDIAGFVMGVQKPDPTIESLLLNLNITVAATVFFFTFFFAFFLLHMFMFLYNRQEKANFFFSIFCLFFAIIFLAPYLRLTTHDPIIALNIGSILLFGSVITCMSLSGFLNELFNKNKLRFRIIAAICAIDIILWFIDHTLGAVLCFAIMVGVCIEAIIIIIIAFYRRVKGAYIVGIGILSLCGTILGVIVFAILYNSNIDMNEAGGMIIMCFVFSIPVSMSVYLSWNYSRINKDLAVQLKQVETLSDKTIQQEQEKQRLLENRQEELEKEVEQRTSEIKKEKQKSDDLLRNILPEEIAEELKQTGSSEAKYFDHVSVIFTDFVNFTKAGERMTPQELVDELHTCFKAFDEICSKYDIEKIKTIGDAYLAVCGLPLIDANHAINTTRAAIEIREFIAERTQRLPDKSFHIRIGIHSGAVVAGIVGVKKFAYDIWGDTVNTAARMEQHGESGKINVSQNTYELIKGQFNCTFRGQITAKNKGELNMYFVDGEKQ